MALTTEAALRKDKTNAGATLEHRHFATIAAIIESIIDKKWKCIIAEKFADELRHTNPKFDRARFLRACGIES